MSQKILHGINQISSVLSGRKILLVRGKSFSSLNISDFFKKIPHVEFSDFTPNPLYEQVVEGIKVFNENECDTIVAVGGGSAIDVAKCIKLFCRMDTNINYLEQEKTDTEIPLIAIPTTAGTGSESTKHAVIYYKGEKQSISHDSIVPDIAVLEASVLKHLPIYQKKCTMLDALAQAIESWWSVNSTEESKQFSQLAISGIKDNWEDYIFENTDESLEKIMVAANYSGRAINITATTAAHAMSYKITSLYGFPHGHAVAICLPKVWDYMLNHPDLCTDPRGQKYLIDTLNEISSIINLDYFNAMISKLELDYPHTARLEKDIDILSQSVNPVRLKNNPVELSTNVLKGMYERIVK